MGVRSLISSKNIGSRRRGLDIGVPGSFGGSLVYPEPIYLLDYAQATFTRASEASAVDPRNGWNFYDLGVPWVGNNIPRIMSDGAILIEGARMNGLGYSEDFNNVAWTKQNALVGGADSAPDGGADAWRIDNDGVAPDRIYAALAGGAWTCSAYAKAVGGNKLRVRQNSVGNVDFTPVAGAWTRYSWTNTVVAFWLAYAHQNDEVSGAGVVGETVGLWGAQAEVGSFPSSYIRTTGLSATRAVDICSISNGTKLDSGRWSITLWPEMTQAELAGIGYDPYILLRDATHYLYFPRDGGAPKIRVVVGGVVVAESAALTWSKHQAITITVDWGTRQLIVAGATTGNGSVAISGVGTWAGATGTALQIAASNGSGDSPFYGVLSRPRAA